MKLIILRHGETDCNAKGIMQGKSNIPLNQNGIKQVSLLKEEFEKYDIDYVISSPLKRAVQTATLVSDKPLFLDDRLIERNLGLYEGKDISTYDSKKYGNIQNVCTDNGVEAITDVIDRTFDLLDEIVSLDKTILLVSHSAVLKVIPYYFEGLPQNNMVENYKLQNTEYRVFEIEKRKNNENISS